LVDVLSLATFKLFNSSNGDNVLSFISGVFPRAGGIDLKFLLPVGFSFYILQAISYLVDVNRRRLPAAKNLIDFALCMAYFPKMISGPIERISNLLPKLEKPRKVDNDALARSFTQVVVGLVRKLVIAQVLSSSPPNDLFINPGGYAPLSLFIGLIIYAFWLYNDFAGYTCIVRGISGFFGIELMQNFQQPYLAHNFVEFWNHWHISLSYWLRDYIYFPISRWLARRYPDRENWINVAIPPTVTMLVSGLWHNFSSAMLLWGGLHGIYQVIERCLEIRRPIKFKGQRPLWRQGINICVVFCLTTVAWVPFASGSINDTYLFYRRLIKGLYLQFPEAIMLEAIDLILPGIVILLSLGMDWAQYHGKDEFIYLKWPLTIQSVLLAFSLLAIGLLIYRTPVIPTFIYQGF
jgi:D-alanyl-lipoteichoic acid acyltransferase DltB (MBOAT superfamily)